MHQAKEKRSLRKYGSLMIVGAVAALAFVGITHYTESVSGNAATNLKLKVDPSIQTAFNNFVSRHQRSFLTQEEYKARLAIFRDTFEAVQLHNSLESKSYKLAINKFSDMSKDEFSKFSSLQLPAEDDEEEESNQYQEDDDDDDLLLGAPQSLDWRDKGAVNPVFEQTKLCGACYAMSTTGAVEAAYKIKTGKLVELSKQQILDCAGRYGNAGCSGGYMVNAYKYMVENKLMLHKDYPYVNKNQKCQVDTTKTVTGIKGYTSLPANDPVALFNAIQNQPVSVGVQSSKVLFHQYKSGVLDDSRCGQAIDHAMLLIGYGNDKASGKDYWLVKNSWGEDWGDLGYVKILRDMNRGGGICGINRLGSYPTL
eukprot:403342666